MAEEATNNSIYDKIRAAAVERRNARTKEKEKADEFLARARNSETPLNEVNRRMRGENK